MFLQGLDPQKALISISITFLSTRQWMLLLVECCCKSAGQSRVHCCPPRHCIRWGGHADRGAALHSTGSTGPGWRGHTTRNSDTSTSIVMGGYIAPPGPYTLFTLVYRNISNVESRHASCGNASTKYKPSMHDALSIRKKFSGRKKNLWNSCSSWIIIKCTLCVKMLFVASPPSHHGYTGICLPKILSYKFIFTFISATCHLALMTTHIHTAASQDSLRATEHNQHRGWFDSDTWIMKLREGTM